MRTRPLDIRGYERSAGAGSPSKPQCDVLLVGNFGGLAETPELSGLELVQVLSFGCLS